MVETPPNRLSFVTSSVRLKSLFLKGIATRFEKEEPAMEWTYMEKIEKNNAGWRVVCAHS